MLQSYKECTGVTLVPLQASTLGSDPRLVTVYIWVTMIIGGVIYYDFTLVVQLFLGAGAIPFQFFMILQGQRGFMGLPFGVSIGAISGLGFWDCG